MRRLDLFYINYMPRRRRSGSGAPDILNAILTMLVILFLCFSIAMLYYVIVSPKSEDGATRMLGHELLLVTSNSMEDTGDVDTSDFEIKGFKKNTLISIERVPEDAVEAAAWYDAVEVGDVLTVRYVYDRQVTITHRVIAKEDNGKGGYIISLSGDNKGSDAARLSQTIDTSDTEGYNYVMGKVIWTSYPFGLVIGAFQRAIYAIFKE